MRYLYFHGFASSPASRKAQAFQDAFAGAGITLEVPALDAGDFEHLTLSRQLALAENLLRGDPVCLIGSSMGGYLAALYAAGHTETSRLVLLAPAFAFSERWAGIAGPEQMEAWRDTGWLSVYHYGLKRQSRVHYQLLEDARRHPAFPDFRQPALIFHGLGDDTVPVELSREFCSAHPNAQLYEMDSDHELLNVLGTLAAQSLRFLIAQG